MNERIKDLINQAGTDVSGKWLNVNNSEKFAKLIIEECCNRLNEETIRHDGYGYNQHFLHDRLRKHFGINDDVKLD
jgi:hypothetical protein